ncbi:MAG TPA: Hpt domain-containing protein [Novosphingobium sp.]
MAFEAGALDETLAAAAGDDPALWIELRAAFAESLARHIDLLQRARCDANWEMAALRIRGLAASFQVQPLIDLAEAALSAAPGEPTVIRALRTFYGEFAASRTAPRG